MVLSDNSINYHVAVDGMIEPYNLEQLQPCSYDFILDKRAKRTDGTEIDLNDFVLEPGDFILASTNEYFRTPLTLCGEVKGKSSIGRLGLVIENAGHIDPGFEGNITLEVCNISNEPISLSELVGKPFGQIIYHELDGVPLKGYNGHYVGQKGATTSWMSNDKE